MLLKVILKGIPGGGEGQSKLLDLFLIGHKTLNFPYGGFLKDRDRGKALKSKLGP